MMGLRRAFLYWHTVRHLRAVQIWGRLLKQLPRPPVRCRAAPHARRPTGAWAKPARRRPSMVGPLRFRFLNVTSSVQENGWHAEAPSTLWQYNLHYFDDLNAIDASSRRAWHKEAISDWIRGNPPSTRGGWDPYPTSLRVVNWIKWALGGVELGPAAMESLATQVRSLSGRLEYHLLGNHLFANAKALVFAGLFFEGGEARVWLERGTRILEEQVPEQILEDGGHFERSTMYHALALEDVLDLINVARAFDAALPGPCAGFIALLSSAAREMKHWLLAMMHPDGEIAFFNDAAIGVAPQPSELLRYAADVLGAEPSSPVAVSVRHLRASGYVRADFPDAALFVDVGLVGPDYMPGHAHADTLSFELSLFGSRVIVNGGTSCYGTSEQRQAERGTAAHSTVTVDGADSSEVWSGFRVARRARPENLRVQTEDGRVAISCAHDGYRRLRGRPVHERVWEFSPRTLSVRDSIRGKVRHAVARYLLHPSVECVLDGTGCGRLRTADGREIHWRTAGGQAVVDDSIYASEFGLRQPIQCIAVHFEAGAPAILELKW